MPATQHLTLNSTRRALASRRALTHAGAAALLLLSLAGCASVGKNYTPPTISVPSDFASLDGASPIKTDHAPIAPLDEAQSVSLATWWRAFGDDTLTSLVARACTTNLDVRTAIERVRESRALLGIEDSARFPSVDTGAEAARRKFSSNTGNPGPTESNRFHAGLDASWEIDVFGGVRRSIEAATADLGASEAGVHGAMVSVAGEVARVYVDLREAQQRRAVVERGVAAQARTVELVQSRLTAGVGSQLELAQAQVELASRRAMLPPLALMERTSIHRLSVLTGQQPAALRAELEASQDIPAPPSLVSAGLPSDLLLRRPDVRQAERAAAAACARVGVSEADLYPRFSLTGSFGLTSEELDQFTDISSRDWSIGPTMRWNLFDGGRIRRRIDAASSRERQTLITYERTVLLALEDVENSLTQVTQEQARAAALHDAVEASERAATLADDRYRAGVSEFLNVLESQRRQYDTMDQSVQSRASVARAVVGLYKSLGGGWSEHPDPTSTTSP